MYRPIKCKLGSLSCTLLLSEAASDEMRKREEHVHRRQSRTVVRGLTVVHSFQTEINNYFHITCIYSWVMHLCVSVCPVPSTRWTLLLKRRTKMALNQLFCCYNFIKLKTEKKNVLAKVLNQTWNGSGNATLPALWKWYQFIVCRLNAMNRQR